MKPKNNIVFCYGSRRKKMLFESQSKADNFIKFNKDNILESNGYAPIRSYYCEFCCGFHVTSSSSLKYGEILDKKEHDFLQRFSPITIDGFDFEEFRQRKIQEIDQAESKMSEGDFLPIEQLHTEFEDLMLRNRLLEHLSPTRKGKFMQLKRRVEKLYNMALEAKEFIESDNDEISFGERINANPILKGFVLWKKVIKEVKIVQKILNEGDVDKAIELKDSIRKFVSETTNVKKKSKAVCSALINELEAEISRKRKEINNKSVEYNSLNSQEKKYYRADIIEIINLLEEVKELYEIGDYKNSEIKLDIAELLLSKFEIEDSNTAMIKEFIEKYEKLLKECQKE